MTASPAPEIAFDAGNAWRRRMSSAWNAGLPCLVLLLLSTLPAMPLSSASAAEPDSKYITDIKIETTGAAAQTGVPVTFGQVFARGDVPAADTVVGKTADGASIPLQFNPKATYPDGSIRHAVISALLPALRPGHPQTISLSRSARTAAAAPSEATNTAPSAVALLKSGFSATVSIVIDGQLYTAQAAPALAENSRETWLSGPVVNEWLISAPLLSVQGVAHPHLQVRYAIRDYGAAGNTRIDIAVENDWAYQPGPRNFIYDVAIDIDGRRVYAKTALTHYHHARWRKIFWRRPAPQINIRENAGYLIDSRAIPNYDRSIVIPENQLKAIGAGWSGDKTEPMGAGAAMPAMPTTGGRPDIGLMPGWLVSYLLSMDSRARDVALGTADLAGSWSVHYRDQKTGRPVSLADYPYMTILGHASDTINPATKKAESFPECANCSNPNNADSAHEPAFNYLPYLLTGDYYQLEELQFWAMWNAFKTNPGYRGFGQGLVHQEQVRDQAWSLRNIAEAAFITPDKDPLKAQLQGFVRNNLDWYNRNYTNNPNANSLGVNVDGGIEYANKTGIAPWMDDFFTASIGHIAELGFAGAGPLLFYKAKFPVSRMTDPGYCWIFGAAYAMAVRATADSALYTRIDQAYLPTLSMNFTSLPTRELGGLPCAGQAMAGMLKLRQGEMTGYSGDTTGFPSNMQPALAYSVDAGAPNSLTAWRIFMNRSVQPNYATGAQFAILPR